MHIGGGLSRLRTGVRTVHLAEILANTEDSSASRDPVVAMGRATGTPVGPASDRVQEPA